MKGTLNARHDPLFMSVEPFIVVTIKGCGERLLFELLVLKTTQTPFSKKLSFLASRASLFALRSRRFDANQVPGTLRKKRNFEKSGFLRDFVLFNVK